MVVRTGLRTSKSRIANRDVSTVLEHTQLRGYLVFRVLMSREGILARILLLPFQNSVLLNPGETLSDLLNQLLRMVVFRNEYFLGHAEVGDADPAVLVEQNVRRFLTHF